MRHKATLLLGIALSALFLWLALRDTDLAAIGDALARARLVWTLPFLAFLFAFYWLKSQRWRVLLAPSRDVPTTELFPIVMIGYAGTALLPMQLGEFVRVWIAGRRFRLPLATVLGTVAIERVFDLLIVLGLLGYVLIAGDDVPAVLVSAGYTVAAICAAIIGVTVVFTVRPEGALARSGSLLRLLPSRVRAAVFRQLENGARSLVVLRRPAAVVKVTANSAVQWLLMGACIACSLYATGIDIPVTGALLVLVATVIGISIPTGPGYIGNIQLAFILAMTPYDIEPARAFVASVFYHVVAYVSVVVAGLFFLSRYGYNFSDLRAAGTESTTATD